jgi:hypothetical protein
MTVASIFAIWGAPVMAIDPDSLELFNQRILPIFRSPNPSSCVQCHLSSVDLKQYILPSSDATFVSLRDQGLIDLQHPAQSKILESADDYFGEAEIAKARWRPGFKFAEVVTGASMEAAPLVAN